MGAIFKEVSGVDMFVFSSLRDLQRQDMGIREVAVHIPEEFELDVVAHA